MSFEIPSASCCNENSAGKVIEENNCSPKNFRDPSLADQENTLETDLVTKCISKAENGENINEDYGELHEYIRTLSIGENLVFDDSDECASAELQNYSSAETPNSKKTECTFGLAIDTTPLSAYPIYKRKRFRNVTNRQSFISPAVKTPLSTKRFFTKRKTQGTCEKKQLGVQEHLDALTLPSSSPCCKHYRLQTLERPQVASAAFRSISGEEIAKLLESTAEKNNFVIIDCRYPYEYRGGHIKGAINVHDPVQLEEIFFPEDIEEFKIMVTKYPIFYCEYSQKRGPTAANYLREVDRSKNEYRYPELDYEEIYVLDRGYKNFFEDGRFTKFCEPPGYVRMFATPFRKNLAKYHAHRVKNVRRTTKKVFAKQRVRKLLRRSMDSPSRFLVKFSSTPPQLA